jgi:tRNA(Ile2) C34 agmatinyltransferase TiaS
MSTDCRLCGVPMENIGDHTYRCKNTSCIAYGKEQGGL